jgi:hypothetical protein
VRKSIAGLFVGGWFVLRENVLLVDCWWLICSERKRTAGWWLMTRTNRPIIYRWLASDKDSDGFSRGRRRKTYNLKRPPAGRWDGMGWNSFIIHTNHRPFSNAEKFGYHRFLLLLHPPGLCARGTMQGIGSRSPPPTHTQRPAGRQCNGAFAFIPSSLLVAFF